jgi:hypothetical protein
MNEPNELPHAVPELLVVTVKAVPAAGLSG